MVRFLPVNTPSRVQKRGRTDPACAACRKSKRRCNHVQPTSNEGQRLPENPVSNAGLQTVIGCVDSVPGPWSTHPAQEDRSDKRLSGHSLYFGSISTLALLQAASDTPDTGTNRGIFQLPSSCDDVFEHTRPSLQDFKAPDHQMRSGVPMSALPMTIRAVLPFLEAESLDVVPSPSCCSALVDIYFRKLHLILPLVPRDVFDNPLLTKSARVALRQALCLVASKDLAAESLLTLSGHARAMNPREFGDRLFAALKISLDIGLIQDRRSLISVLMCMTFHAYSASGIDETVRLCSTAVHYAYALGLHSQNGSDGISREADRTMLCCLWCVDKMVSAIAGRPPMFDASWLEYDLQDCLDQQKSPGLRIVGKIMQMLDIALRLRCRPHNIDDSRQEHLYRVFEKLTSSWDVMLDCSLALSCLDTGLRATLEIFYYAVAILVHTSSPFLSSSASSQKDFFPDSLSHILREERIGQLEELCLIPFVPYALSVAVAIFDKSSSHVTGVTRHLRPVGIKLLLDLSSRFWLAEKALLAMETPHARALKDGIESQRPTTRLVSSEDPT